ncbi:sigma-70 family RNA polymerase sigma factor [Methylomonas sp. AM2-LC]|uniref:sigma-70 family RNA polymerase sigma factor n=1 Tax=Methylomonas sp. AM2-LC TaxID=3153301 RepID=UPI003265C3DC
MPNRKRFLEILFLNHGKELLAFARQRSGVDCAEDLVQETYTRILQHPNPEAIENPRAFLYKTATNLSVDLHRRQSVLDRALYQETEAENDNEPDSKIEAVAAPGGLPEDQLGHRQELDQLNAALMELPELTRYAFVLHRLEGLSHQEIAHRLGISLRNSERYVAQASRHILIRMEESQN